MTGRDRPDTPGAPDASDAHPLHPAYFTTRFHTEAAVPAWPAEFVILSACATTGETWSAERTAQADRALESELRERSTWVVRITGSSPSGDHAEPSWAAILPLPDALDVGRRFLQDALYIVRGDALSVTRCSDDAPLVHVGSFAAHLDQPRADH